MENRKNLMKKIKTALISLSDKSNLLPLLKVLKKNKVKLISSGGTYQAIRKLKFECLEIAKFTNFNEILDGRVKTLHPKIHAGILYKRNKKSHINDLKKNKFESIDLVIVNFYPFEKTIEQIKNHNKIIENIDIGGPSMARSAAKNYNDVTIVSSPENYNDLINELKLNKGSTSLDFRKKMSQLTFAETAYYDSVISKYLNDVLNIKFPNKKIIHAKLIEKLRYGENPHQEGAIYSMSQKSQINQIYGKKLSYNNYNDIFTAIKISQSFGREKGTVIIKHANPCGVSLDPNGLRSFKSALNCDPVSAFGGVVLCNFKINRKLAIEMNKIFLEVIIAKGFNDDALKIFKTKKNLRLIDISKVFPNEMFKFKSFDNKILIQSNKSEIFNNKDFEVVSKIKPNKFQLNNLLFALNICRYVKSNAIVLSKNMTTVGIGSGQPSRLDSCNIAIEKMKRFNKTNGDIFAASDAFFPFVDGIEKLIQSGVTAVIQPSGSIRDKEIIKFANSTNTILVFSKKRYFSH